LFCFGILPVTYYCLLNLVKSFNCNVFLYIMHDTTIPTAERNKLYESLWLFIYLQ